MGPMIDAKSLSQLRDEWLQYANTRNTDYGAGKETAYENCAAALVGPIERERRLMKILGKLVICGYTHGPTRESENVVLTIQKDSWQIIEDALVTPGAAQEGKGHGE